MNAALLALLLLAAPASKTAAAPVSLAQVAWMAGNGWRAVQDGEVLEELWLAPSGSTMLGVSRTVKDGRTVGEEYLRIEERAQQLVLTLVLGLGRPPRSFVAVRASASEVEFHSADDPNGASVVYRRTAAGMDVRVEGRRKGESYVLVFHFVPARLQSPAGGAVEAGTAAPVPPAAREPSP